MASIAENDWHRCLVISAQVFMAGEDFDVGLRIMTESTRQDDFLKRARAADASNVEDLLPDRASQSYSSTRACDFGGRSSWPRGLQR
jgi:hypothetical protein